MPALPTGRPPFRADHVGSLLRPRELREAFRQHAGKGIGDAEFRRIQDDCIARVVRLQEDAGLEVVTDGEFRRGSYWGRFVERCEGLTIKPAIFKFHDDHGHDVEFTAPYAAAKLRRVQPLALDEFAFLKSVAKATPKITLPAPSTMHFYRLTDFADRTIYPDHKLFFSDLIRIYQEEIAALGEAGCKYAQLDEVAVAVLCDPAIRARVKSAGSDPDALVDLYVDALNQAIATRPSDMVIGVHMCRGNFKGHYLSQGGYESVAERFFTGAKVNHFLLEYDTPRAGDFTPLRFVPKGKGVVLGLVSTKTGQLEELDMLKRRTEAATQFIDRERLAISPQCGFASTAAGNALSEADEEKKLRLIVEAARVLWPEAARVAAHS
jgi:5-methyltetrahydropteroyltriglutamate--homocysteine methyltransferase